MIEYEQFPTLEGVIARPFHRQGQPCPHQMESMLACQKAVEVCNHIQAHRHNAKHANIC
jgi:hypothetical protein